MNALILAAEGFEDLELFYPIMRFQEEDFEIQIASETTEAITGQHGYKVFPDITLADIREPAWDMVIIPSAAHM
ncbi:peptidase, partial [bacterium]|nr:peptidase [bacterium]